MNPDEQKMFGTDEARRFQKIMETFGTPTTPTPQYDSTRRESFDVQGPIDTPRASYPTTNGVLPKSYGVTQGYGNRNDIERFSGGVNYGTDFGTPENTPLSAPPGKWKVVSSFAGAKGRGYIGNSTNSGYGNSILLQNAKTGERIRFSHLNKVYHKPGTEIEGGTLLGLTGDTGNTTGYHLDTEYYNQGGKIEDILNSPYGYLFR